MLDFDVTLKAWTVFQCYPLSHHTISHRFFSGNVILYFIICNKFIFCISLDEWKTSNTDNSYRQKLNDALGRIRWYFEITSVRVCQQRTRLSETQSYTFLSIVDGLWIKFLVYSTDWLCIRIVNDRKDIETQQKQNKSKTGKCLDLYVEEFEDHEAGH